MTSCFQSRGQDERELVRLSHQRTSLNSDNKTLTNQTEAVKNTKKASTIRSTKQNDSASETVLEEIEFYPNPDIDRMGTCCSKPTGYKNLSCTQKDRLNIISKELVIKAGVDFSSPEIKDIQSALSEMLDRIKTRMNKRGVLRISHIVSCGSMAEKTAMWKYGNRSGHPFIEFDFLAVLQAAGHIKADCQECFRVDAPLVNVERLKHYYRNIYYTVYMHMCKDGSARTADDKFFTTETNDCLTSCGCLNVIYTKQYSRATYRFVPSSTRSETLQGCDKCTVDRPTGTLRVKTSVDIGDIEKRCSLIFNWTSKSKTLCTRNQWCLPETEKMDNLTIHIDFLPALELFQSKQQSADVAACSSSGLVLNPTGSEDEHYCFLVPKYCAVCDRYRKKDTWRRSGCRAEIDTVVNKMTDKHRKCYQVLKHLNGFFPPFFNNYHLKIGVLHHNNSCSDANEDCAKCVFNVLDELQHAYETGQLKSFHSEANLLEQIGSDFCDDDSKGISRLKKRYVLLCLNQAQCPHS